MATVANISFPIEDRLEGEFAAWTAAAFDEPGAYIDAPDASALWYFLDSDIDETYPVGIRIIDPSVRPDRPIDRMVQTITGDPVRLRDALVFAGGGGDGRTASRTLRRSRGPAAHGLGPRPGG